MTIKDSEPAPARDTASLMPGIAGVKVTWAEEEHDGRLTVWAETAVPVSCPRGTFTEWVPQVPPRCRITRRLPGRCGDEIADRGITPSGAARHNGVSWPSAHKAFGKKAGEILADDPEPVIHLGTGEHRRGRARWMKNPVTGDYVLLRRPKNRCRVRDAGCGG